MSIWACCGAWCGAMCREEKDYLPPAIEGVPQDRSGEQRIEAAFAIIALEGEILGQ